MDITKGIEPFEDRMDVTRSNPDRKPYGKSENTDQFNLGSEYAAPRVPETVPPVTPPVTPPADPPKFTHKLANGETLEAATMEEMATKIEQAISKQQQPVTIEFEDKPVYQPYEFKPKDLTLTEQADILNLWKENPQKAKRLLDEADYGAPAAVIIQKLQEAQNVIRMKAEEEAGAEFLMEADSYNATVANGKKLTALLQERGKPITKKNLLAAFSHLVAAGDKSLLRAPDQAPPVDDGLIPPPEPPTIVPSNQGMPLPAAQADAQKFAAEFASWPLSKQQQYFAKLKQA